MRATYGDDLADTFWDPYFDGIKLWVTETSCSGDFDFDKENNTESGLLPEPDTPTNEASCQAITGQKCQHQQGSVQAMLELDNVTFFCFYFIFLWV